MNLNRRPAKPPVDVAARPATPPGRPQPLDPKLLDAVGGGRGVGARSLDLPKGTWR